MSKRLYQSNETPNIYFYGTSEKLRNLNKATNAFTRIKNYQQKYPNYNNFPSNKLFDILEVENETITIKMETHPTIPIYNSILVENVKNTSLKLKEIVQLQEILVQKLKESLN